MIKNYFLTAVTSFFELSLPLVYISIFTMPKSGANQVIVDVFIFPCIAFIICFVFSSIPGISISTSTELLILKQLQLPAGVVTSSLPSTLRSLINIFHRHFFTRLLCTHSANSIGYGLPHFNINGVFNHR
jgi:hypothetical protein